MQLLKTIRYAICLLVVLSLSRFALAAVNENFDGWSNVSYGTVSTYNHTGVGQWETYNTMCHSQNARSGNAVRFNDDSGHNEYLDYLGTDGNGKDGGVGTVSFWYRHWDADGSTVKFQLQTNINAGGWADADTEVTVQNDTNYHQYSKTLDLNSDNVKLRVKSTVDDERLLIDDYSISDYSGGGAASWTNIVKLVYPTTVTSAPDVVVEFHTWSLSNGTADIGRGTSQNGSGWTWLSAGATNVGAGYGATNSFSISSPGTYYYAARWVRDGNATTNYGWNANGQTNASSLTAEYQWIVTNPSPASITNITVMSANLTDNDRKYEDPGIRICQGLKPDIVGIQEFNVTNSGGRRGFVDTTFGTNYSYYCEAGADIPNGVISRWPILASGEWNDVEVGDRDFAWSTIDIPGDTNLHVVSVHFKSGDASVDETRRENEAKALTNYIQTTFSDGDYIVLCGDLNIHKDPPLDILKTILSDTYQPADQNSDKDTNELRNERYDYVLPNSTLDALHGTTTVSSVSFANGLVFDSSLWNPPPSPILTNDSHELQHMAVMKTFSLPHAVSGSSAFSTNIVKLVYPTSAVTTEIGAVVEFFTVSESNGTAQIGYGETSNGSGWAWPAAGATNVSAGFGATNSLCLTPGTYYYAARWIRDGNTTTNYGWNASGQTSETTLVSAEYFWVVTNSSQAVAIWDFGVPGDISPTQGVGTLTFASGLATNWPDGGGAAGDLFISEYCEGSSNNKYIEIFNGTGGAVDLSSYRLQRNLDGGSDWAWDTLVLSGALGDGDVFVVCNSSAVPAVTNEADLSTSDQTMMFNGDDGVALAKNDGGWTIIDAVGNNDGDPGSGWPVGDYDPGTANHTLVRKGSVTIGNTSWATCSNEWNVYAQDTFTYLGTHTMSSGSSGDTLEVDGFPTGTSDKTKHLTFMASTAGKQGVGFYFKVRRDTSGARKVDVQYTKNGGSLWNDYITNFALDDADVWYHVGGKVSDYDSDIDLNADAGFRIIGYDAVASDLEFDQVEISSPVPEPALLGVMGLALQLLPRCFFRVT